MKQLVVTKLSPNKMITSNGYLICTNAVLARTGKQQYLKSEIYDDCDEDEIIEIDRKPEQVFADATISSFENVPLTCEHPYENVTPENYKEYSVGYVRDVRKGKYNNQDVLLGTLVVTDPQCIQDIQNGYRTELSCGYDCDISEGKNPQQINIRGNHVALCEQGRAGIAKIVDSATDINNYYKVDYTCASLCDSKKFASLTSAMEFSRRIIDDNEVQELTITEFTDSKEGKVRTLVEDTNICDVDLAVGSIYEDRDGNIWQIVKIEGSKYILNVNESEENKLDKHAFESMIGQTLVPAQELRDSYVETYKGKQIFKTNKDLYKSDINDKELYVSDSLDELKDAIDKTISREELVAFEKDLSEYLGSIGIYPSELSFNNTKVGSDLFVELYMVIDGDWKHDHIASENAVEGWCSKHDFVITGRQSQEIGDSETDSYEAEYKYYICINKDMAKKFVGDSVGEHTGEYSEQFYSKLKDILEDNLEEISDDELTVDFKEEDEARDHYRFQRNKLKRELRNQIQNLKK